MPELAACTMYIFDFAVSQRLLYRFCFQKQRFIASENPQAMSSGDTQSPPESGAEPDSATPSTGPSAGSHQTTSSSSQSQNTFDTQPPSSQDQPEDHVDTQAWGQLTIIGSNSTHGEFTTSTPQRIVLPCCGDVIWLYCCQFCGFVLGILMVIMALGVLCRVYTHCVSNDESNLSR